MTATRRRFLSQISLATLGACRMPLLGAESPSLPRGAPAAEGVTAEGILAFIDAMEQTHHELHSLMILRHGRVVAEGWASPYAPNLKHTMYSMSKSFTSTAVGLAVAEGKLTVDDKVISFFPDDLPELVSGNLAALRVKHLLTMSVGNEKEPTGLVVKSENWVRTFLAQPITHKPGTTFMYNSTATYMCSAIVQKVTGMKVIDYLKPRLFEPLGISGMTWEECPRGINTGGWGLSIQSEGLAKFGQLYLQKGQWQGKQLIPADWVDEATSFKIQQPKTMKPERPTQKNDWQQGYCYQFWRCQHNAFRGDGAFGQFTIVLPEHDAVIVMTEETKDMQGVLDLVWEHLLPAFKAAPLTDEAEAQSRLAKRLKELELAPLVGKTVRPSAPADGKRYVLSNNSLGLTAVTLNFTGDAIVLKAEAGNTSHVIRHGIGKWTLGETRMPGTPPRLISGGAPKTQPNSKLAASATMLADNTLELTWRYIETPHHDTVTCKFEGDKVTLTFLNSISEMSGKSKDERPVLVGKMAA